jgi:hypothetical protein
MSDEENGMTIVAQDERYSAGRGGDLRLIPGAGVDTAPDGDVILQRSDGRPWLTVKPTGKVEFAEDFDAQQATRAFWSACGEHHPVVQRELFVAMSDAIDALRYAWVKTCQSSYADAQESGLLRCLSSLKAKYPSYRTLAAEHRSWLEGLDHQDEDRT